MSDVSADVSVDACDLRARGPSSRASRAPTAGSATAIDVRTTLSTLSFVCEAWSFGRRARRLAAGRGLRQALRWLAGHPPSRNRIEIAPAIFPFAAQRRGTSPSPVESRRCSSPWYRNSALHRVSGRRASPQRCRLAPPPSPSAPPRSSTAWRPPRRAARARAARGGPRGRGLKKARARCASTVAPFVAGRSRLCNFRRQRRGAEKCVRAGPDVASACGLGRARSAAATRPASPRSLTAERRGRRRKMRPPLSLVAPALRSDLFLRLESASAL